MIEHPDSEAAWRHFKDDDSTVQAPGRLRHAVLAEWDAAHPASAHPVAHTRRRWLAVAAVAAAIVVAVAGTLSWRTADRRAVSSLDTMQEQGAIPGAPPEPVIRLVADPAFENELLSIVRVRLPRTSLEAMGISLVEPESASLVDLDVVVGGDGLPRAIQAVRLVVDMRNQ